MASEIEETLEGKIALSAEVIVLRRNLSGIYVWSTIQTLGSVRRGLVQALPNCFHASLLLEKYRSKASLYTVKYCVRQSFVVIIAGVAATQNYLSPAHFNSRIC